MIMTYGSACAPAAHAAATAIARAERDTKLAYAICRTFWRGKSVIGHEPCECERAGKRPCPNMRASAQRAREVIAAETAVHEVSAAGAQSGSSL